jgi:hypothetical protein
MAPVNPIHRFPVTYLSKKEPVMKNTHCAFRAIFLALWLLCGAGLALAQGTNLGTIRGTVTDPNVSIIVNAKVQVTDLESNLSRYFTTEKGGNYEAVGLKSGNYRVSVSATGFKTSVAEVVLRGADTERADIKNHSRPRVRDGDNHRRRRPTD